MSILQKIKQGFVFFDGGMGTELQKRGMQAGEMPELWNITHPEIVTEIHREYYNAGADIVTANTFGANSLKLENQVGSDLLVSGMDVHTDIKR